MVRFSLINFLHHARGEGFTSSGMDAQCKQCAPIRSNDLQVQELKSGQATAAREVLIALEKSAHSAGFGLIANRASALQTSQKKDSPPSSFPEHM